MLDATNAADLPGKPLHDSTGEALGAIVEIFLNTGDDTPAWAQVDAGDRTVVVPLLGAELAGDGGVRVDFARDAILEAPDVGEHGLDNDAQKALWAHYGLSDADLRDDSGFSTDRATGRTQGTSRDPNGDSMVSGHP